MRHILLLSAAAMVALSACNGNGPDSDTETTTVPADDSTVTGTADTMGTGMSSGMPDAGANAVAMSPQAFAQAMAASDRFEMESARIAQGKSPPADVRDFAAMMLRDHMASTDALKQAVGASADVTLPATPSLTSAQQTQLEQLRTATGSEFAMLYARQQVAAHEMALSMLTGFAASGDHAGLKQFAGTTAERVRMHLEQARTMNRTAMTETGPSAR